MENFNSTQAVANTHRSPNEVVQNLNGEATKIIEKRMFIITISVAVFEYVCLALYRQTQQIFHVSKFCIFFALKIFFS